MADVGYATLAIIPSFKDMRSNLEKGLGNDLDRVGNTAGTRFGDSAGKTAGKRFGGAFKTAAKASLVGVAALGVGAFKLAKDSVNAASDLEESTNKVRQVFGRAADDVFKFSSRTADSLGQSNQSARDAAATFGIMGKAAKLGDRDNARFSKRLTRLASDLASFNNTSPEQAIEALGSALRGEAEPIRAYGVLLDEATLKAEAAALGLLKPVKDKAKIQSYQVAVMEGQKAYNDAVEEFGPKSLEALKAQANLEVKQSALQKATEGTIPTLTTQQKVLAANSAIFKQTGDAQGDFARTSDGLANQQRRLAARFEDTKAKLGEGLLPIVSSAADFLLDKGIPAFEDFADYFNRKGLPAIKDFADELKPVGRELLPAVKDSLGRVKDFLEKAAPKAKEFVGYFNDMPDWAKNVLVGGGAAAIVAKKLGLGGLLGRGAKSALGGSLRSAKPIPVFVTNQGFGTDGSGSGGGGKPKKGKPSGGLAAGALSVAAYAIPKVISNFLDGESSDLLKAYDKEQAKARALSGALGEVAKARTGVSDSAEAVAKLDEIYARTTRRDPGRGLSRFEILMTQTELSADELRAMLPRTASQIDKAGGAAKIAAGKTDDWFGTIVDVKKQGKVVVPASTPGMDAAIRKTNTLKGLVESFDGKSVKVRGVDGGRFLKGLASGGPVNAGQTYLVGERGPELFQSSQAGRIIPNHQLSQSTDNSVSFAGAHIYVQDGADLMRKARRHQRGPALGSPR